MGLMVLSAISPLSAQTPANTPAPVEVSNVRFNSVRINSGSWYEAEIELQVKSSAAADNRGFINRVKTTLNLGVFSAKAPSGAKVPDTYYRASAEAVAVEQGGGKTVIRFYLPPEIVKRDQITGDPKFYLIELSVDGKPLPLGRNHFPVATFGTKPDIVESFRSKVSGEAGVNDGILLPQYLTPFAYDNSRQAPSFIRIESTR
jgi:hypothetical protein